MNQREAVIKAMESNGGFATLGYLYKTATKIPDCEWRSKTPFASIRRIVQDDRYFFRIKPGLWGLKSHREKLPPNIYPTGYQSRRNLEEFNHSYYQGLLVEIGNLKQYGTYIPNQDKNRKFLQKKLGDLTSLNQIYHFSYDSIIRYAQTIDVIWFNVRKFPAILYEIEHTTDIQRSLLKFVELQDFYVKFYIVADELRKKEFRDKISLSSFEVIKHRTLFLSYDRLSDWHAKSHEINDIERSFGL